MTELQQLFGKSPEVKVWDAIIPYGLTETVYVDDIIRVTGLHRDQVARVLDPLLAHCGGYSIDYMDRACFTLKNSGIAQQVNNIMHMVYSDRCKTAQAAMFAQVHK